MSESFSIRALRKELKLPLGEFGPMVGVNSRGRMSEIERGGPVTVPVAIRIEELSGGRIDAGDLNDDVALARKGCACSHEPSLADGPGVSALKGDGDFNRVGGAA